MRTRVLTNPSNYDISLLAAPEVVKITTTSDKNVKMTIFLCFNSLPPSAVYTCMRQWNGSAVVQAMACRLFGAKPLPEPMLTYFQLNPYEQTTVKFAFKYIFSIVENAFENVVCEMSDILSRGRWVNKLWLLLLSWLLCFSGVVTSTTLHITGFWGISPRLKQICFHVKSCVCDIYQQRPHLAYDQRGTFINTVYMQCHAYNIYSYVYPQFN